MLEAVINQNFYASKKRQRVGVLDLSAGEDRGEISRRDADEVVVFLKNLTYPEIVSLLGRVRNYFDTCRGLNPPECIMYPAKQTTDSLPSDCISWAVEVQAQPVYMLGRYLKFR